MISEDVSSVFVDGTDGRTGIVTERDVLRCVHERGQRALETTLAEILSTPLHSVPQEAFVYRAIGRMDRLGIRHLGVTDADGELVGAVTTRNLLRHRATAAMVLGDDIASGTRESDLATAWARVPAMAEKLIAEDVDPRTIAAVVSAEICMLTRRAAEIGEQRLCEAGHGTAPTGYAVLVLGSAGRGESLLAADQDNAIVYRTGEAGGPEDRWFGSLGGHIADILDQAGIPYCKGGVMARNRDWRQSLADWRITIDHWVGRQRPEDLLNVDIFFDALPVHGDAALGEEIWSYAYERSRAEPSFRRVLSETLTSWRSPVSMFGGLRTGPDDRTDLKLGGLMPLFTAARILSIRTGTTVRQTPDRLRSIVAAGTASTDQIEELAEAHQTIMGTMLYQQIGDIAAGLPPGPRIDPRRLSKSRRAALVSALRQVQGAIDIAREGIA